MGQTFTPSLRKAKLALVRALIEPERLIPAGTVDVCDEKSIELALGPAQDVCRRMHPVRSRTGHPQLGQATAEALPRPRPLE